MVRFASCAGIVERRIVQTEPDPRRRHNPSARGANVWIVLRVGVGFDWRFHCVPGVGVAEQIEGVRSNARAEFVRWRRYHSGCCLASCHAVSGILFVYMVVAPRVEWIRRRRFHSASSAASFESRARLQHHVRVFVDLVRPVNAELMEVMIQAALIWTANEFAARKKCQPSLTRQPLLRL